MTHGSLWTSLIFVELGVLLGYCIHLEGQNTNSFDSILGEFQSFDQSSTRSYLWVCQTEVSDTKVVDTLQQSDRLWNKNFIFYPPTPSS